MSSWVVGCRFSVIGAATFTDNRQPTTRRTTFAKGAFLKDPAGLFNSSLEGNVRRAIDFHEGDKLDERALKALIRAAVALNKSSARG